MNAYHLVQDHSFMAITDALGEFELHDLPLGDHKFIIWHERPGYLEKSLLVTIVAGEEIKLDLSYHAKKLTGQ